MVFAILMALSTILLGLSLVAFARLLPRAPSKQVQSAVNAAVNVNEAQVVREDRNSGPDYTSLFGGSRNLSDQELTGVGQGRNY